MSFCDPVDRLINWIEKQQPPRPGLIPKTGDWRHPYRWIVPEKVSNKTPLSIPEFIQSFQAPFQKTMLKLQKIFPESNIEGRLKLEASLREKARKRGGLENIKDVAGTRIHFINTSELWNAVNIIRKNFNVLDEDNYITIPKDGFYRAYHLTIEEDGKPVEIQLRLPCMTRLAEWAHNRVYKHNISVKNEDIMKAYLGELSKLCYGIIKTRPFLPSELAEEKELEML